MTTLTQIKQAIKTDIADDQKRIKMAKLVKKALTKFWGKDVSKRVIAPVEAALKEAGLDYYVFIDLSYSYNSLKIQNRRDNNDYYSFTLNYHSEGKALNEERFDQTNASYDKAAQERIDKNTAMLNNVPALKKLAKAIDALKAAKATLEEDEFSSYNFPARYEVEKFTEIKERR